MMGEGVEQPVAMPGAPCLFSATSWELRRPAPTLSEHTAEVRAALANCAWVGESAILQVHGASACVADRCSGMEGLGECGC